MERRFRVRRDELLGDAEVHPDLLRGLAPRLEGFVQPFVAALGSGAQRQNATHYIRGLVSNLGGKTAEAIAYLHDRERQGLQKFVGQSPWDHRPLLAELARQVGVYLAYVSRREHALVDVRLYLPEEWTRSRRRMRAAGVPLGVRFRTRHQLILDMLDERGGRLPHAWVSGDGELGRSSWLRQQLQGRGEAYLLSVPPNTSVRDLAAEVPYAGCGRYPKAPFTRIDRWAAALPTASWQTVEVRDAEKGPLVVQVARGPVQALAERRPSDAEELAVAVRERQPDGTYKPDYLLSNAPPDTPPAELARVFKARNRIEECLKRAKGEAGLADYQVRTWAGWHHPQALSLLAPWFLTRETRRGKKADPGADSTAGARGDRATAPQGSRVLPPGPHPPGHDPPTAAERGGAVLSLPAA